LIVPICAFAAATRRGCPCPWTADHQDDIPSISCLPSAMVRYTPSALDTTKTSCPGSAHGCQICAASISRKSFTSIALTPERKLFNNSISTCFTTDGHAVHYLPLPQFDTH